MRGRRSIIAAVVSSLALLLGPFAASPAAAAVGASALTIDLNYLVAAPGETFTLSGTATDGVGAVVTLEQQVPVPPWLPLGTAVVQPDGTWSAEVVMPAGADSLLIVHATTLSPTLDGHVGTSVYVARSAGGTDAVVTAPSTSPVTGSSLVLPIDVVLDDPAIATASVSAVVIQGGSIRGDMVDNAVPTGLGTLSEPLHTDVDLERVANGPALIAVSFYVDNAPVALALKEIVVDLDGGVAAVDVETLQSAQGFPYLSMRATVATLGPGAAVSWRIDDGPTVAATLLQRGYPERFSSGASIFDSPTEGSGDYVGAQLIAEGPHVAHVSVTNRGTTTVYDVPFVIDTSPHLTIDSTRVQTSVSDTLGWVYRVDLLGHASGVWMPGATVEVLAPEDVTVLDSGPPTAGVGPVPAGLQWTTFVKVGGWDRSGGELLRVRVRLHALDGSEQCIELALRSTLPPQAECGATVPGAAAAVPTSWTEYGLPFDVTWTDDGGSPVSIVRTSVSAIPGVPGPQPYTGVNLLDSDWAGRAPMPAPGTAYRVSFGVENTLGAGALTEWGVVQASGVDAASRTVKDGASLTVSGSVVATVPTLSIPATLPAGSASILCRSRSTGLVVLDVVRTPAATTRAFGATLRPRSNVSCLAKFLGDAEHGVAPSRRSFTVSVAPVMTASLADASVPRGSTTRLIGTVSAVGRSDVVRLQRWSDGAWRDVQSARPTASGRVGFDVRAWVRGTTSYRVVQGATTAHLSGASALVRLTGL